MKKRFADLHSHVHTRTQLITFPDRAKLEREGNYTPWTVVASNINHYEQSKRASSYGQGDLVKLWNGNVRLIVNALYPMEKGFFRTPPTPNGGRMDFLKAMLWFISKGDGLVRDTLQNVYMRLPIATINYIQSEHYDYWNWLQEEYQFLLRKNNQVTSSEVYIPKGGRPFKNPERLKQRFPKILDAKGAYTIPSNHQELRHALSNNYETIVMLLSVEGGHALGTDSLDLDTPYGIQTLMGRARWLKQQIHPIFFMTLAHHYYNKLCGHARSIPWFGQLILNQEFGINTGMTKAGKILVQYLLSINQNGERDEQNLGHRILIDIRHMSVQARIDYYKHFVMPALKKGDKIPIICSHGAFSGQMTLQEMIKNQEREIREKGERDVVYEGRNFLLPTNQPLDSFYAWSINVCAEEIKMIFKTGGLLGLSFDQRITGVPPKQGGDKKVRAQKNTIRAIWNNLKTVLNIVCKDERLCPSFGSQIKAWDMLVIGADFDGYIDPVDGYASALELETFREDLGLQLKEAILQGSQDACVRALDSLGMSIDDKVEWAMDKVCYKNLEVFVLKHYPRRQSSIV